MPQPNPEYIRELVETINTSPFPKHMAMRLAAIELDKAVIELKTSRSHLQAYGIVHGGVLATLIDTATFWSVYLRIPEDAGLVNIDLKLNYLKPVANGLLKLIFDTCRCFLVGLRGQAIEIITSGFF
jgi:uncharacterized protein (TIGR00369 family)